MQDVSDKGAASHSGDRWLIFSKTNKTRRNREILRHSSSRSLVLIVREYLCASPYVVLRLSTFIVMGVNVCEQQEDSLNC